MIQYGVMEAGEIRFDNQPQEDSNKLYRSEDNRIIAGVAAGLAEYFKVDANLARIIFVLITIFGGTGILIYLAMWIIIPSRSNLQSPSQETIKDNVEEIRNRSKHLGKEMQEAYEKHNKRRLAGLFVVGLGILILLANYGFFDLSKIWPILIIALGFAVIRSSQKN